MELSKVLVYLEEWFSTSRIENPMDRERKTTSGI